MSQFIPLDALDKQPAEPRAFELWLPNPVMGRALFLRLPLDRGWTFEFDSGDAEARRHMVYRDRMWVSEGKARFFAIRTDGSQVEVNVSVQRWKPRTPECYHSMAGWRLLRHWLGGAAEELMKSRCCRTERQIEIAWKAEDARPAYKLGARTGGGTAFARSDVALLLSELRCH